jgi:hypothetical protein
MGDNPLTTTGFMHLDTSGPIREGRGETVHNEFVKKADFPNKHHEKGATNDIGDLVMNTFRSRVLYPAELMARP